MNSGANLLGKLFGSCLKGGVFGGDGGGVFVQSYSGVSGLVQGALVWFH